VKQDIFKNLYKTAKKQCIYKYAIKQYLVTFVLYFEDLQ